MSEGDAMHEPSISVLGKDLAAAYRMVQHAAADNLSRPILASVVIEGDAAGVRLIAADNYRIAVADLTESESDFGQAVIRIDEWPLIVSLARSTRFSVEIVRQADGLIRFAAASIVMTLRPIDGTFPNYRSVLPMTPGDRQLLGVNPKYLRDAASAMSGTSEARMYVGGPESPFLVIGRRYREAIMPLRVSESARERDAVAA